MVIEWSLQSFERMQAMCLFLQAQRVIKLSCEQSEQIQMESSENNPWGCSENHVNLALAGFFAIIRVLK